MAQKDLRRRNAGKQPRAGWADSTARMLLDDGMTTSGLNYARAAMPGRERTALARELVKAFLALDLSEIDPADVWKFAPSLTYLFGIDVTREVLKALEPAQPSPVWLLLMAALEPPEDPAATPEQADTELAEALETETAALVGEMGEEVSTSLELLLSVPRDHRATLAVMVLGQLAPAARQELAVLGLLAPTLGQATRGAMAADLARDRDPARLSFLATLDEATLGSGLLALVRRLLMRAGWAPGREVAAAFAGDPRTWPVTQVLESSRDGTGSQGTYLVRRRGDGRFAFIGVIENASRGAVDGVTAFDLSRTELRDLLDDLASRSIREARLSPALAAARMDAALARCRALGHPLPFVLAAGEGLLAGAATAKAAPAPTPPASGSSPPRAATAPAPRPPAALPQTWILLHTTETAGLRVAASDSAAAAAYLEAAAALVRTLEAGKRSRGGKLSFPPEFLPELRFWHKLKIAPATLQALTRLAATHADAVFDAPRRRAWQAAMADAARGFAGDERPLLAGLATDAAAALDPASGVAMAEQPFVHAAMALSLFAHLQVQAAGAQERARASLAAGPPSGAPAGPGFMGFAGAVFAALPMEWPPADYRIALLAIGEVWNAGVGGKPMGGAMAAARVALGKLLADARPAERRTVVAALEALPARWALEFAGDRRRLHDVRTSRAGVEVKIDLVFEEV